MLSRITIKNLVIVRSLDLAFESGMTALTGETGAGKSILIDALALALGERADSGMIRKGDDTAEVTAVFDLPDDSPPARWLATHDLAVDGECLVRRVLVAEGRSRAYINGTPSPLSALRELGELLVDIHGQHAHQSLLKAAAQRALLDEFAGLTTALRGLRQTWSDWQDAERRRKDLDAAAQDRANRLDYLQFQIAELESLPCDIASQRALEQEHSRLAHAERLLTDIGGVIDMLDGSQGSPSGQLNQASATLGALLPLDGGLADTLDLIEAATIQIDEARSNLRHDLERIELDPDRLHQVDEQLGQLHDAARKHRVGVTELGPLLEQLREEIGQLEQTDSALADLDIRIAELRDRYRDAAEKVSKKRQKAAKRLAKTVTDSMQTLSMEGGRFRIECRSDPDSPGPDGIDRIEFMVAANPGQSEGPLGQVASGGELSRISLAIQVATADCGAVPTLIFDEVDVGIGGAVAEIVGQLLQRLGTERQVLCVTHLPQVASQAHRHLRVNKLTDGKVTETRIDVLTDATRVEEIARMLGGVDITSQTRKHAEEMMRQAQHTC